MLRVQKHNEEKLNEAFRTAPGVFLFFSVNMSGHFQGYARMASPVSRQQVGRFARMWEGREGKRAIQRLCG